MWNHVGDSVNEVGCFWNEAGYFRKNGLKMMRKERGEVFELTLPQLPEGRDFNHKL